MSSWLLIECPIKRRHAFQKSKWNYRNSYKVAHGICGLMNALNIITKEHYPHLCRRISNEYKKIGD